ncbi:potassium channel family protein [Streptomyces sp. NPDC057011]|uniref:potassium channel family protein n=1 Tax=unclassified Streptomyces TaxID=2593676 RepID=UPI00363E2305
MSPPIPRRPGLLLAWHLLRATACTAVPATLYFLAPLDQWTAAAAIGVLLGALLLGAPLIAWQFSRITRAAYPRLRAMEALATAVPLFLLLFSAAYFVLSREHPRAFTEILDRTDALYFTVAVFATVGFGDIAPVSAAARALTTVQMVADLIAVGLIVKVLVEAVRIGLRRKQAPTREEPR